MLNNISYDAMHLNYTLEYTLLLLVLFLLQDSYSLLSYNLIIFHNISTTVIIIINFSTL